MELDHSQICLCNCTYKKVCTQLIVTIRNPVCQTIDYVYKYIKSMQSIYSKSLSNFRYLKVVKKYVCSNIKFSPKNTEISAKKVSSNNKFHLQNTLFWKVWSNRNSTTSNITFWLPKREVTHLKHLPKRIFTAFHWKSFKHLRQHILNRRR